VPDACGVTRKRYGATSPKSDCPSREPMVVAEVRPKRRYARMMMKVLIGVDPPQGVALAVAALDEAKGGLLERASFPQDRAGLRSLER
jgi:hypothetical protein